LFLQSVLNRRPTVQPVTQQCDRIGSIAWLLASARANLYVLKFEELSWYLYLCAFGLMRALDVTAIGIMRALLAQKPVQLLKTVPKFAATARSAAVLVPLCNDNGVPRSVLFSLHSSCIDILSCVAYSL
jgi:hypothetical protein